MPLLAQEAAQKPAQDSVIVVPVGTVLPVSLNTYLNTKNTQVGDTFYADTTYPIWIQQRLVIPRGSIVKGTVTEVQKPGKISGKGRMGVRFQSILLPNGVERALVADFHGIHGPGAEKIDRKTETVEQGGTGNTGQDVGTVIGTAGQGAMIGGLATGRTGTGAGIGAGAGAAAGLAIVLLSRDRDLVLQPGTQLDLELRQPLTFAYGEIIFSQTELNSSQRAPVIRPGMTQTKPSSAFSWLRFLRIWRW
jgi:type IV secretion system protein VirB10